MTENQADSPENKASSGTNLMFLIRLLPYTLQYKWLVSGAVFALMASAAFELLIPQGIRMMVDNGLTENDSSVLVYSSVALGVIALFYGIASALRSYLVQNVGARIVRDIRRHVFAKVITQGIPYFDKNRVGDIISRLNSDVSTLGVFISSGLSIALVNMLLLAGIIFIMLLTSWLLTLAVVGIIVVLFFLIRPFEKRMKVYSEKKQSALAQSSICVDENISGIRTVQAFNQSENARDTFAQKAEDVARASISFGLVQGAFVGVSWFVFYSIIAVLLFVGGQLMINGTLSAGEFTAFMVYAFFAMGAGGSLINFIGSLNQTAGATKRLFEILDTATIMPEPANPHPLPPTDGARGLRVENVSFAYPSRPDQPVFTGLDLTIQKGETVAVVGPSGGGKSTLFKLLMREYDPQRGCVKLDDVNVRELSHKDLRSSLVPVPQDPSMFSLSVLENIRYGKPDASQEDVIAAAKAAHAHDFIERLAGGYDTYVGEKGVQLSGGQKQRIAIARAFLCQPQVLLLDEATSNLDAQSEQAIKEALETIKQGRTTLIIAHRLATVIHADRILVMDNGQIVSEGTHQELMKSSKLYRSFVELQMLKQ